ncbi:hypothetical protein BN1723_010892, partial [Verticillium longisporum]
LLLPLTLCNDQNTRHEPLEHLHSPGERPAVPNPTTTATEKQVVQPHIGSVKVTSVQSSDDPDHDHRPVGQAVLFAKEAGQTTTSPKASRLTPNVATPATLPCGLLESGKTVATLGDATLQADLPASSKPKKAPLSRSKPGTTQSRPKKRARESSFEPKPKRTNITKAAKLSNRQDFEVEDFQGFTRQPDGSMTCLAIWAPTEIPLSDVVGPRAMEICEEAIVSKFGAEEWAKQKAVCFGEAPNRTM